MSVRDRLILTFALVGVLLIAPAVFAARGLSDLRDLAVEGRGRHAQAALSVGRIEAGLAELDLSVRGHAAQATGQRRAAYESLARIEDELARIEAAGYVEAVPPLSEAVRAVRDEVDRVDELVASGALADASGRFEEGFTPAVARTRERLIELADGIDARAQADFERARSIGAAALRSTLVAVLVTIGFALVLSTWTTRALTHPLQRLRTALASVTAGDFDVPADLPYERKDEIGELSVSFGIMSRRLAELDRLRAEFLGVASHELKTPINVIRGYAELIEEELAGEITPHQREIMQRIGAQTETLARQVSRLMDISRLETGSYALEPRPVALDDLVLGAEKSFEVLALEKGIRLEVELDPSAPVEIVVDPDLISDEVLSNLISNALKFTPEGGRVTVNAWGEGDEVVIEVSDTGPGIPPEHRDHVFGKYYQVERSRSIGSGLGLAIAKDVVEAHGGTIELRQRPGPGATFRVRLPTAGHALKTEVKLSG